MKSKLSYDYQVTIRGLALGLTLFATVLASAQNFVKNPDFEEPLGTNPSNNWTVVYDNCDPWDFLIADRSTMAHKDIIPGTWDGDPAYTGSNYWSRLGGHFAPNYCNAMPHAYFRQVITGLPPLSSYECSAWMIQMTRNERWLDLAQVYMEVLGGAAGNVSRKTPYVTANANNNPQGWQRYVVTNTASTSGKIEIRLHYKVIATTAQIWEYRNMNAFYDHVAVVPLGGQAEPTPPYKFDSLTVENQTATFRCGGTVFNHIYGIQVTSDPVSGTNWNWAKLFMVGSGPHLITDLPITTNVTGSPVCFRLQRIWPYP